MNSTVGSESEIKFWLKTVLKEININDFFIEIVGNSAKGDGYVGDIVFVSLKPVSDRQSQNYNLVLKCSKRSKALRETTPIKTVYLNEIYVYKVVFPTFKKFQLEKGITDPFNSFPKCYGTLVTEDMEIIVFDNLKELGYTLWDKKKPLTRKHIDLVIDEYAKFHGVSFAMKDQEPERFEKLCCGLCDVFQEFMKNTDMVQIYESAVEQVFDLLQGELDPKILLKWKTLKNKINFIFTDMVSEKNCVRVILHGDCWSNNFMFMNSEENELMPKNIAVIDWQISRFASPVLDLSYFLFASISKEDIINLEDILRHYYKSLSEYVGRLGSNLELIYPIEEFLVDWKEYSKYGLVLASLLHKICSTDKDEVVDIAEVADKGEDFTKSFDYEVRDKGCFRSRSKHVVKYAVENGLI